MPLRLQGRLGQGEPHERDRVEQVRADGRTHARRGPQVRPRSVTVGHVCGAGFDAETTAAICGGNVSRLLRL
jgi:hypothetical protein